MAKTKKKIDWLKALHDEIDNIRFEDIDEQVRLLKDAIEEVPIPTGTVSDDLQMMLDQWEEVERAARDMESQAAGIIECSLSAIKIINEEMNRRGPPPATTLAKAIIVEPNYEAIREMLATIKKFDPKRYAKILLSDGTGQTARWLGEPWPYKIEKKEK